MPILLWNPCEHASRFSEPRASASRTGALACLHVTTHIATLARVAFEWDDAKNRINFAKHGLDFADAELVLAGLCVTFVDNRFEYGEDRFITLGLLAGRLLTIAHAPRGEATRIISMRKANRREQKIYQKRLGTA
jgi:uncharacterized DUF497 family protein